MNAKREIPGLLVHGLIFTAITRNRAGPELWLPRKEFFRGGDSRESGVT